MDYTYFAGSNQAFHHPYGGLPAQTGRVHEQLAGDVPTVCSLLSFLRFLILLPSTRHLPSLLFRCCSLRRQHSIMKLAEMLTDNTSLNQIFDSNFIYDGFPFDPHTSAAANGQATTVTSAAHSRFPTIPPPLPLPTVHNEPPASVSVSASLPPVATAAAPALTSTPNLNGGLDHKYAHAHGQPVYEGSPSEGGSSRTIEASGNGLGLIGDDLPADEQARGRTSSSEEKEAQNLTPAQSRRKAQNRAAYVHFLSTP